MIREESRVMISLTIAGEHSRFFLGDLDFGRDSQVIISIICFGFSSRECIPGLL